MPEQRQRRRHSYNTKQCRIRTTSKIIQLLVRHIEMIAEFFVNRNLRNFIQLTIFFFKCFLDRAFRIYICLPIRICYTIIRNIFLILSKCDLSNPLRFSFTRNSSKLGTFCTLFHAKLGFLTDFIFSKYLINL